MSNITKISCIVFSLLFSVQGFAGEADVINATFEKTTDNHYRFSVTVQHDDTGWEHYADKWEIFDTEGNLLATRTLAHPHVHDQPFTRSLSNIKIPSNIKTVVIKAHDSKHQYGGKSLKVNIN